MLFFIYIWHVNIYQPCSNWSLYLKMDFAPERPGLSKLPVCPLALFPMRWRALYQAMESLRQVWVFSLSLSSYFFSCLIMCFPLLIRHPFLSLFLKAVFLNSYWIQKFSWSTRAVAWMRMFLVKCSMTAPSVLDGCKEGLILARCVLVFGCGCKNLHIIIYS